MNELVTYLPDSEERYWPQSLREHPPEQQADALARSELHYYLNTVLLRSLRPEQSLLSQEQEDQ